MAAGHWKAFLESSLKQVPPSLRPTAGSYKGLAVDERSAAHSTWVPPKCSTPHGGLTSEQEVNLTHAHPHPPIYTALTEPTLHPNGSAFTKFETARSARAGTRAISSAVHQRMWLV